MRKGFIIIIFMTAGLASLGQRTAIDSLNTVIRNSLRDSARVNSLIELSSQYYRISPDEAVRIGLEAKELAEELDYQAGLAQAYKSIGMGYYFANNWVDAMVNWKLALAAFETAGDQIGVANMLNNLGAIHFSGGDDEPALNYYMQSLRVAEEVKDTLRIATALVNIGSVYLNKESTHHLAFEYYKRALPLSMKLGDHDAIGTSAVNMGEIFLKDNRLDSALYYFEMALDAYRKQQPAMWPMP